MVIGPGQAECRDERRPAVGAGSEFVFDARHRCREIALRSGPTGRINAWLSVERGDRQSRIVGQGGKICRPGSGQCLELGVGGKRQADFLRLGQP